MNYDCRHALVFYGSLGLGEFIGGIVRHWQAGEDFVLAFHIDRAHESADCDCPKLVFTREELGVLMPESYEAGGPQA